MATPTEALTDTYINELIQKKIAQRGNIPQVQAAQAQSDLAKITGASPLAIAMSGLNAIGQGITGGDRRVTDQTALNQKANIQNFNNQESYDNALLDTLQAREKAVRDNKLLDSRTKANTLAQQKYDDALERDNINKTTAQNTAARTLEAQEQIGKLNADRLRLGDSLKQGVDAGWLTQGAAGQDYALAKPTGNSPADNLLRQQMETPEYQEFAENFGKRQDIEDSVRDLTERWEKLRLSAASNKNTLDDFNPIDIGGLAQDKFKVSAKTAKRVADEDAADDAQLASDVQNLVGSSGIKNTAFSDTVFSLDGSLDAPEGDPLAKFRTEDNTAEVNNMFQYAKGESPTFNSMSPEEQKYIMAKFLADKQGASESFWDISMGQWSEDVLDAELPNYITNYLTSQKTARRVGLLKADNARKKLVRHTDARYGG